MSVRLPDPLLFCGVRLTPELSSFLKKISDEITKMYISDDASYLQEMMIGGVHFLGKKVKEALTIEKMELLEANISSILQKLIPDFSIINHPVVVIGYSE